MSRSQKQLELARRRARAGAEASARSPKRRWPLRKVVDEALVEVMPGVKVRRDVLECGHAICPARDFIGETYPARRRCGKCYREGQATGLAPPEPPVGADGQSTESVG